MPINQYKKPFLNLIEIFPSIQGETSFMGLPTAFVRLASCNLRCHWCDTTYSFGRGTPWELEAIIQQIEQFRCRYVCITGGEPLLQSNVHLLMSNLCDKGLILSLETGGSLPIEKVDSRVSIILDIKCPGSGMSEKNYWPNLLHLRQQDEVKFVLMGREDYLYAIEICDQHQLFNQVGNVLYSPVHGQLDPKELVSWMLEDSLPIRLNLQLHKYIWDPLTRGV
jgi:7-carboxy-7-deazaguanine synthase